MMLIDPPKKKVRCVELDRIDVATSHAGQRRHEVQNASGIAASPPTLTPAYAPDQLRIRLDSTGLCARNLASAWIASLSSRIGRFR